MVGFLEKHGRSLKKEIPFYVGGEDAFCIRRTGEAQFGALDRKAILDSGLTLMMSPEPAVVADHAFTTGRIGQVSFETPLRPTTPRVVGPRRRSGQALRRGRSQRGALDYHVALLTLGRDLAPPNHSRCGTPRLTPDLIGLAQAVRVARPFLWSAACGPRPAEIVGAVGCRTDSRPSGALGCLRSRPRAHSDRNRLPASRPDLLCHHSVVSACCPTSRENHPSLSSERHR